MEKITVTGEEVMAYELDKKTKNILTVCKYACSYGIGYCSDSVIKELTSSLINENTSLPKKIVYAIGRTAISGSISYLVKKNIEKSSIFAETAIKAARIYREKAKEIKDGSESDTAEEAGEEEA